MNKLQVIRPIPEQIVITSTLGYYFPFILLTIEHKQIAAIPIAIGLTIFALSSKHLHVLLMIDKKFRIHFIIHQGAILIMCFVFSPIITMGVMMLPSILFSWHSVELYNQYASRKD